MRAPLHECPLDPDRSMSDFGVVVARLMERQSMPMNKISVESFACETDRHWLVCAEARAKGTRSSARSALSLMMNGRPLVFGGRSELVLPFVLLWGPEQ